MSQWTPWASGRAASRRPYTRQIGFGGSDQYIYLTHELHLIKQDGNDNTAQGFTNSYHYSQHDVSALPNATTVLNVVDDPVFFGNSKPNSLSYIHKSFKGNLADPFITNPECEGSSRIWLYRDSTRTEGVYAEIVDGVADVTWDANSFGLIPGNMSLLGGRVLYMLLRWGTTLGQVGERSLDCLPFAYPSREVAIAQFVTLRHQGYGSDSIYVYQYNIENLICCPLQLSVIQYPGQETATAVIHDFAGCGFVYAFDSGINFIPEGETSPVTFGQVAVTRGQSRTVGTYSFQAVSPAITHLDINRRTINPSSEYAHSAHFPKAGQKKWGMYMARLPRKAANPTAIRQTSATLAGSVQSAYLDAVWPIAFHSDQFTVEKNTFLDGVFGAPDQGAVGHWTILEDDNQLVDANVAIKAELIAGELGYDNILWANFDYWQVCGKHDPQSRPLTHNCAQGASESVNQTSQQIVYVSSSSGTLPLSSFIVGRSPSPSQPAVPDISGLADVTYSLSGDALTATLDSIEKAIQADQIVYNRFFSLSNGDLSYIPTNMPTSPFRRGELIYTLEKVQWFARIYYPYDEREFVSWTGEGLPAATEATSETMAYIASGANRSIPVSTQRLRVDLLGMFVGRIDLQNYETFWRAYEQTATGYKFSNYWITGPAIPEPRFCTRQQRLVQASYLMTKQETASFKAGGEIQIPRTSVREPSYTRRGLMYDDFLEPRPFYSLGYTGTGYPLTVSIKLQ